MYSQLKVQAIELRKQGLTYSEILKQIPVAKSTLSDWLHSVQLSKYQKQRLTGKKLAAMHRGAESRHKQKLLLVDTLKRDARIDIGNVSERELWLMGTMLYWGEGSKEKSYGAGINIIFTNSDPLMNQLFILWLKLCLKIPDDRIVLSIYIHKNYENRVPEVIEYWMVVTGFSREKFDKIYYKKHNIKSNRKNKGNSYYGILRITVSKSSNLNRKITGWIEGICMGSGVAVTRLSLEQKTLGSIPSSPALKQHCPQNDSWL